jgi:hypothetical protein
MRPWAAWRTIETRHYRIHFPNEFERWAVDAANRVESIDSAITRIVGSSAPKPVDVVVHDPYSQSNGYALPFIDHPTTVWWATPPDPRSDIGDYRAWSEMLSVHELTHLAHLTRQTRNPPQRVLWSALPAHVGPVARKSPRWVIEGYATVVEGQITGSGRPNGVWRPALLRQWAIEGRLPTYQQMSGSREFAGGDFAYLSGSAFLEWLLKREGDSSLVSVWRRLSARTSRSFDQAFAGVYGDAPAALYGRHVAELTGDAMRAQAELERVGIRDGELVQRLNWDTGDPAITSDGDHTALTVRERERPSRLVVWRTVGDSVDPARDRRRAAALRRDPEDVADRNFYPPPKRVERTLDAVNGLPYLHPRWFADNRRLMVTRWTSRPDGTTSPDLYIWNTTNGNVLRLTRNEHVLQGDPSPDSREAVAMRCHIGHCDIVRVYLTLKSVTSLLEGNPHRSYYRPRFSPDGQQFAASVSDSGHWRIVVAGRDGKNVRVVSPEDGANRYDAEWLTADSLIVVSERGGVPNLEVMSVSTGGTRSVTRVAGAAVAPVLNKNDGSVWFLSLHSRGLDVRRLPRSAARADSVVAIDAERFGFAGVRQSPGMVLGSRSAQSSQSYGRGPVHGRWLPGMALSADGIGGFVTLFRGDLLGRLNTTLTGAYGEPGAWQGASLRAAWRYARPVVEVGFHAFEHEPSRGRNALPGADSLDARGYQAVIAVSRERRGDGWRGGVRVGGVGGLIVPDSGKSFTRAFGFADVDVRLRQQSGARGAYERVRLQIAQGTSGALSATAASAPFQRVLATLQLGSLGRDVLPMEFTAVVGRLHGSRHPFEEFTLGGAPASIVDSAIMTQRYDLPMLPTGVVRNRALMAWRVAFPLRFTIYAEGAALATDLGRVSRRSDPSSRWHRAIGIESRLSLPPIPVAFAPAVQTRAGIGYSLDAPVNDRARAYVVMRFEP